MFGTVVTDLATDPQHLDHVLGIEAFRPRRVKAVQHPPSSLIGSLRRAQLWQWVHHKAKLADGRVVDLALVESMIAGELNRQKTAVDAARYAAYEEAADLMRELVRAPKFMDFLTLPAYQRVLKEEKFATE